MWLKLSNQNVGPSWLSLDAACATRRNPSNICCNSPTLGKKKYPKRCHTQAWLHLAGPGSKFPKVLTCTCCWGLTRPGAGNDAMTVARLYDSKGTDPAVQRKHRETTAGRFSTFSPARNIHSPRLSCTLLNNVHLRHANLLATALLFLVLQQVNTHKLRSKQKGSPVTATSSHPAQWA